MTLYFSTRFKKNYRKIPQNIRAKVDERLTLFRTEPRNPILANHPLEGELAGFWSINVTGDWRILYEPVARNAALLIRIGTHAELYGT